MSSVRVGWAVVGLVLLALGLRVGLAVSKGVGAAPVPGTDQYEYDTYAWNVAQGRGYRGPSPDVADQDHLTAYRPPGPSLMWAGLYEVFGNRYAAPRVANCVLGALAVAVVFGIGALAYGRWVGLLAAAGYAVWPTAIMYSADLLSEPLGTFLFLMALLLALRYATVRGWGWAVGAGLCLGAAALTRPNFVFMIPLAAVWVVWLFWRSRRDLAVGLLVPGLAVAMMVPWGVRNYRLFHAFIPVSTGGGSGLLQGNNRIVADPGSPRYGYSVWDSSIPEYAAALHSAGNEVERDRRAKVFAEQWIRDNPRTWLRLEGAKLVRGWTPVLQAKVPLAYRLAQLATWGTVLVLFPWAFVATLVRGVWRRDGGVILHLAIVEALAINLIFWGETRYRAGIDPLCLVWAAVTVVWAAGRVGIGRGVGAERVEGAGAPVASGGAAGA